jgi:very-short-patch-repair endonuclease
MRHEPSRGEWLLWQALCRSQQGVAFRRQVVLQGYVADFYACVVRLIVEVDGAWHCGRARSDARRDRVLGAAGYRVLRVSEQDVLSALPQVVARIRAAIGASG